MEKKIIIIVFLLCAYNILLAQKTPPQIIKTAFEKKFPNATMVKWDKESKNEYEASFVSENKKYSANFDISGNWLETEENIDINTLPLLVKNAFIKRFVQWQIVAVSKISNAKLQTKFEIEMQKGKKKKEVFFNENGVITH